MAKKKAKKPQKQVEWASPPNLNSPAEDPVPALPEALPVLSAPEATHSTSDESTQGTTVPSESNAEVNVSVGKFPVAESPAVEPATEEAVAEDAKIIKEEEVKASDEKEVDLLPIAESAAEPATQLVPELEPTKDVVEQPGEPVEEVVEPVQNGSVVEEALVPQEPVEEALAQSEPVEETPAQIELVEEGPAQPEPVEEAPVQIEPVEEAPAQPEPVEKIPAQLESVEEAPTEAGPIEEEVIIQPEPIVEEAPREPKPIVEETPRESEPVVEEAPPNVEQVPQPAPVVEEAQPVVEEAPQSEPIVEEAPEEPTSIVEERTKQPEVIVKDVLSDPEPTIAEIAKEPEPIEVEAIPDLVVQEEVKESLSLPDIQPAETVEVPVAEPEHKPDPPTTIRAPSPTRSEAPSRRRVSEEGPVSRSEPPATFYAPSPKYNKPHPALTTPSVPPTPSPPPVERRAALEYRGRPSSGSSRVRSPPRPPAVAQAIVDDRPPAPTPPVGRTRPRHSLAFDSDDDDDDFSLIQPRLRGDPSRLATYPPPSSHPRSLFASRVPAEHYSPPPPQPPPPGYHHRYYPPAAPSYHPHHGYNISQNGGYPNPSPYGPPPPHQSSPYQESWGQFPPTYPYGNSRQDSIGSREYPMGPPSIVGPPSIDNNSSAVDDDGSDVFSRISQAIPDLHVLLAKYKETHGQLGVREDLLRRAGVEQQEKLRNKDDEIHHLKDRITNMESKHSSDASRLRLEIGNMEEQMKELREQTAETERFRKEAEETRIAFDAAKVSWETRCKKLEETNAHLARTSLEEKEKAQKEFDDWRSTANRKHDAEKIALAIQFDKKLKEADMLADKQRQEVSASFVREKEVLRSEHQRQQRERESNYDRVRKELETKLSTAQKDREEALIHERESREIWEAERETLGRAYEEDRQSLQRGWDEQRELLEEQHRKSKEDSDKSWIELHADANRKAEEEKLRADRLTKEKDELQRSFNDLRAESQREKEIIRSVAGNLESEKARLEKLMECYGDIAEIKSKGDTYYSVSFSHLQRQIVDLANTHFVHLPVSPPPEDLAHIPSGLPSFLGDTIASRQLRAAYIVHTVAKMITYRVFGPFLFSLGRRYDQADSLFSSMSHHIRDKSTRKEAIWRQQTLLAAFTSSGAKQRINTAAGTVVDEIILAIKNFADPKEEDGIRISIKRIVKLAAETWRFARLEREMITATMPALQDEEHKFTGPEYWPEYRPEETPIPSLVGTTIPSDEQPKLLLRLFPVIRREPKHENFRSSEDEGPDVGCVYHHGLALYDNAEPVVIRAEELKQAGLPPATNASPTVADFPEPLLPQPRKPLPPTPEVLNQESIKSVAASSEVIPSSAPPLPGKAYVRSAASLMKNVQPPIPKPSNTVSVKPAVDIPLPPSGAPSETTSRSFRLKPSDLSIPPYRAPQSQKAPVVSATSTIPSDLTIPPYRPRPDKAPLKSAIPQSPPSVVSTIIPEPPLSPALTMYQLASQPYTRPIPVPLKSSEVGDAAHLPTPTESSHTSPHLHGFEATEDPIVPAATESVHTSRASRSLEPSNDPPVPTATESTITSPRPQPHSQHRSRPPIPISHLSLAQSEAENDIIPAPLFSRRTSTATISTTRHDSTPTSRAASPPSPLYAAIDEIDSFTTHRSRNPPAAISRRSTLLKTSDEELLKEAIRRSSGYPISNRSSMDGSTRTDRTDRTETSRNTNSRYMCDSRSAAIKGLYPNSPRAGTPVVSRTNSMRSQGRRSVGDGPATWDTSYVSVDEASSANS
ncbi:hypothetical protein K504DRAFT_503726 [Pleomassaria siparia CBS 279.74]|uniref:Uncharacterized protein n=1 Tax=Pleomassaria siparia CBS 279.74 TaxID=1314801 RepID=A0A6G1K536_9PLEO|nr:hypothetical protein K504DRAFT_503726 [Pleomassaria siparia CBS 279.74]